MYVARLEEHLKVSLPSLTPIVNYIYIGYK